MSEGIQLVGGWENASSFTYKTIQNPRPHIIVNPEVGIIENITLLLCNGDCEIELSDLKETIDKDLLDYKIKQILMETNIIFELKIKTNILPSHLYDYKGFCILVLINTTNGNIFRFFTKMFKTISKNKYRENQQQYPNKRQCQSIQPQLEGTQMFIEEKLEQVSKTPGFMNISKQKAKEIIQSVKPPQEGIGYYMFRWSDSNTCIVIECKTSSKTTRVQIFFNFNVGQFYIQIAGHEVFFFNQLSELIPKITGVFGLKFVPLNALLNEDGYDQQFAVN